MLIFFPVPDSFWLVLKLFQPCLLGPEKQIFHIRHARMCSDEICFWFVSNASIQYFPDMFSAVRYMFSVFTVLFLHMLLMFASKVWLEHLLMVLHAGFEFEIDRS